MEYPQHALEFDNILFICFFFTTPFSTILTISFYINWTDLFDTAMQRMTLNNQFFVKLPLLMRRFRDVPVTKGFRASMTDGTIASAYYKQWRLSQVGRSPEKVPDETLVKDEKEETERKKHEPDDFIEQKQIDNSNAFLAMIEKLSGHLSTARPVSLTLPDIESIERQV